jgi:hypothetical protein
MNFGMVRIRVGNGEDGVDLGPESGDSAAWIMCRK